MKFVATLLSMLLLTTAAQAATESAFNKSQITLTIGFGVGGTYHSYAQLFSRHLGRFLPGGPTIIVQNMPGAGGVRLLNEAATRMPADGSNLFMPPDTLVVSQLLTSGGIQYDARRFIYIGTADQENVFLVTRRDTATSIDGLRAKKTVFMGSSGAGATGYLIPAIAGPLLNLPLKPVGGYQGSREIILGMERGELDGSAQGWQVWLQARKQWFEGPNSFALPLIQVGLNPDPDAPDTPLLSALVKPEDRSIVSIFDTIGLVGRSLAMPPGTSAPIRDLFRAAFLKMTADPDYLADAARVQLRSLPKGADVMENGIGHAIDNADQAVIRKARELLQ
jgi:tripartite-type tricarboxylate transporter receptor subunit TctC